MVAARRRAYIAGEERRRELEVTRGWWRMGKRMWHPSARRERDAVLSAGHGKRLSKATGWRWPAAT